MRKLFAGYSISDFWRPKTTAEVLLDQRLRAERAYLSHLAAAETHQMLADAYKARLKRLSYMENEVKSGVAVELVDPVSVFNEVSQ